jgi:DNA topoisomerase-3
VSKTILGRESQKEPAQKIDFACTAPIGKCPKCGGKIFETENSYICDRSQADRKPCKFKLSKTILGRDIPKEQAQKLLTAGRTDLLDGFISKRGRPFSAYLKLEDEKVVSSSQRNPRSREKQRKQTSISLVDHDHWACEAPERPHVTCASHEHGAE